HSFLTTRSGRHTVPPPAHSVDLLPTNRLRTPSPYLLILCKYISSYNRQIKSPPKFRHFVLTRRPTVHRSVLYRAICVNPSSNPRHDPFPYATTSLPVYFCHCRTSLHPAREPQQ